MENVMTDEDVKIEKGVPIPGYHRQPADSPWWDKFEVGDSAFFPSGNPFVIGPSAYHFGNRQNPKRKFSYRTVVEGQSKGVRIWRVE
jgi:hypothetical protein